MSLSELAEYFDIHDLSPDGWPVVCNLTVPNEKATERWPDWPRAALSESGRAASGHGTSDTAARISGLGEAIEIVSLCRWGDEQTVVAVAGDLPGNVWDPAELAGFSAAQHKNRTAWNTHLRGTDWLPPGKKMAEIEWVQARSLDRSSVWVPAEAVFLGQGTMGDPDAVFVADTNGCAAGESDRASKSSALFELIERDATARWWYGCRARHRLPDSVLDAAGGTVLEASRAHKIDPRFFDITTDIGVPVVAAAGNEGDGPVALGFAAAPTFASAAMKALVEMLQMALVFKGFKGGIRPGLATWALETTFSTPPLSLGVAPAAELPEEPSSIGMRLQEAGIRIAFFCQTRPEFEIPVWRAISPDLCHWKPRLGRSRLLAIDPRDCSEVQSAPNPVVLRL
ncbi:YcaO-like family protein [Hoeflea sp.]|uniref:YcaO-like family protein n=1 Tax=Hoeflea sp. TaxID=1940281 RepID=UPI003B02E97B